MNASGLIHFTIIYVLITYRIYHILCAKPGSRGEVNKDMLPGQRVTLTPLSCATSSWSQAVQQS